MYQLGPSSSVLHWDRGAEAEAGLTASSRSWSPLPYCETLRSP